MLALAIAAALAKEPTDPAVAAALVAHPPDLASCFVGVEGHFAGRAALQVTLDDAGKPTKVSIDTADAPFPEDCGLSVLREVAFPPGARTFGILVETGVQRTVVSYGNRVGGLQIEAATRPRVLTCALLSPVEIPDPALGAVVQYAVGPSGKVTSADVVFGAFTGDTLKTCVLDAYRMAKFPKTTRGGAIVVWEPLRWTQDDVQ